MLDKIVVDMKHCNVCDLDVSLSEWTMDEYRCDYCCWGALEMEAYGEYLAELEAEETNI